MIARVVVVLLLLTACRGQHPPPTPGARASTVVLVSLDGFRPDYLDRPFARELRKLAARGVRALRMTPVFPTKTFPNHYSIVTGLYPGHHGIIANTMWDAGIGRTFSLGERAVMADPRWWGGEPLWITAVRQGKRSASFFWPGSDVRIGGVLPTYHRVYDGRVPNAERVRGVLDWLSLPPDSAPAFVTLYFSDVDGAGHDYGPAAPQVDSAIARVDTAVGALVAGLAARGLDRTVNLVVVSDHGMAPTSPERQVFLDDYLDLSTVRVVDWSPVAAIIPAPGREDEVYERLHDRHPHLAVFRKRDLPERWRYRDHARVTPIVAVADDGWHIATRARPLRQAGGTHGYDDTVTSMGALFVAAGPAFRRDTAVSSFRSIHLYELMARIIGVAPAPNDGSLDSVRALLR